MTVVSRELWTRLPGKSSWNRIAGTGQQRQDRMVRIVHLGPDNWDRIAETSRTGQVGLIAYLERTEGTEQPGDDNICKTYIPDLLANV
jgi:hypothetical protein